MLTIGATPGLLTLEAWLIMTDEAEREYMEEMSNTSSPVSGGRGRSNRTKMKWKSDAPTGHKRGR